MVVALFGPMGAGKTTFVQGALWRLTGEEHGRSPTFVRLISYPQGVHHLDLYQVAPGVEGVVEDELIADDIVFVEWADRLLELPAERIEVHLAPAGDGRLATIEAFGPRAAAALSRLRFDA